MASQESVYQNIDVLVQNIELNRRTIISLIIESKEFQFRPHYLIFYLLSKFLGLKDLEKIDDDDSPKNLFLNDEFVIDWIETHHCDVCESLNTFIINDIKGEEIFSNFQNLVTDQNLSEFFKQLYSRVIDNVYSLDSPCNGSELRAESWIQLIFEITFSTDNCSSIDSQNDSLKLIGLNIKLFILEAFYQLLLLSPMNKLIIANSGIAELIIENLISILEYVLSTGEITIYDDPTLLYAQSLFKLYLVLSESGTINFVLLIEYFKKLIKLNEQVTKKKSNSLIGFKETVFITIFNNLLANLEKLNAASNFAVSNFHKSIYNDTTVLMPSNFLIFPNQTYVDYSGLKLSDEGFTIQMWVQFTKKTNLTDSIQSNTLASSPSTGKLHASDNINTFIRICGEKNIAFWELSLCNDDNLLMLKVTDKNGYSVNRKFTNFNPEFLDQSTMTDSINDANLPGEVIDEDLISSVNNSEDSNNATKRYLRTRFHNIVIIHKVKKQEKLFKQSQAFLIIDGQFIQSVNIPLHHLPSRARNEVNVTFGNISSQGIENDTLISFNNLLLINKIQPHQWILLNYFLGFNYNHNYKDLNLMNKFLSYKSLSLFELKSKELKLNFDQSSLTSPDDFEENYESMNLSLLESQNSLKDETGILNRSFGKIQQKLPSKKSSGFNMNFVLVGDDSIILNFHARNVVHEGQSIKLFSTTFGSISPTGSSNEINKSYVLNTVVNSVNNLILNEKYLGNINKNNQIYNYQSKSNTLINFFNSVDGITMILKLIESINAHTDDEDELDINKEKLVILLKCLFSLISQNHVFAREMEDKGGYHILSIILKNKRKLCRLKVLDAVLEFVGYNHSHPVESVIVNSVAYKSLIVDFDIWKDTDKETFKFLLFQFTVFSQDSKYHEYNVNKIVKMKIIKRFVQCLKSNVFTENFLPSVQTSLLVLVKASPSTDIFHSLSTYIIYALQVDGNFTADPNLVLVDNPELQKKCGICILELIVNIVSDSPTQYIFKKIMKLITIRWILLLMDDADEIIMKIALKLLVRMFSILGVSFYTNFIENGGFKILKNLLKKWYYDDEIVLIIFAACFGASQLDNLGVDLHEYTKRLARRNDLLRVSMPEFLYLIFDLIENSIDNNNKNQLSYDYESYTRFIKSIEFSFKHISCLHLIFKKKIWISKMSFIIYKLEIQGILTMKTILIQLKEFLSKIILSIMFGSETFMVLESCQSDVITKKVLTGSIYPITIHDVLKSIEKDEPKLKKKSVCKNVCKFILQCADSTTKVIWERPDLLTLHKTLSLFVEKYSSRYESGSSTLKALKKYFGMLTLERIFILVYSLTEENQNELKDLVDGLLYSQEIAFSQDVLDSKRLFIMVIFLLHAAKENKTRDEIYNITNALRIIFMHRQQDFRKVSQTINSSNPETFLYFFESLLVSDDNTIIDRLNNDSYLKKYLEKSLFNCFEKFENTFFYVQSAKDVFHSIPKNDKNNESSSDTKLFTSFRTENVNWKSSIISSELAKYYRYFQDQQDNFQFFITNFNKMKLEVGRILHIKSSDSWIVDNIEGLDRVHKRIVPKDELSFEDQLLYKIEVPVAKKVISQNQSTDLKNTGLLYDSLSDNMEALSSEPTSNKEESKPEEELEEEDFELIEETALFDSAQEDKNRKVLRSLFVGDRINDLWNVSQLLGLEAEEGILILGETHLYLIENYFHCSNDEVVDIDDAPLDARDPYLQLITGQPKSKKLKKNIKTHNTKSWELEKLTSVSKRQFLLRDVAIEFFFANGSSFLIICRNAKERDQIYGKFSSRAKNNNIDDDLMLALKSANYAPGNVISSQLNVSFASKLASAITSNLNGFQSITKRWKAGKLSNFYYLILVNTIAGRTFNDLTQYPVFPWVIADYTSKDLDFDNPNTFRDFSKPMGAQHKKRAMQFKERYDALKSLNDSLAPPFHYGTHYSSAMIVTSFLIRLEPYVQSYLLLQGGKFDHADRLFYSIEKAWNSASRDNYADVRELIPEFFYLPEFLENSSNFDLGKLQNGKTINNVILPPWANNDPKIFIEKQRAALESPYVSEHLHEWIDLIFGFKQNGQNAIDASNVFHHLSYHGAIDLDDIDDEVERRAMTGIIHNFGQTPLQIFFKPHYQREVLKCPSLEVFRLSDIPIIDNSSKLSIKNLEMTSNSNNKILWKGRPNLYSTVDNLRIQGGSSFSSLSVNGRIFESLHPGNLEILIPIGERSFLTGADDGTINVWKFPIHASKFITFNSSPILSQLKFQEELEFKKTLRGHLSKIIDIKVSRNFNLAISLDELGKVFVWDLVRFKFVREIDIRNMDGKVKFINISNKNGLIAIASDFNIAIFTINGEFIISSEISKEKITNISFADSKIPIHNGSFDQLKFEENHEFWENDQIILISNAKMITLHVLKVSKTNNWEVEAIANFKIRSKDGELIRDDSKITCVEMNLKIVNDEKDNRIDTAEIVAGDSKGHIITWS